MDGTGSMLRAVGGRELVVHGRDGKRPGTSDLAVTLASVPDSVPAARHHLDALAERLDARRLDELRLLVSEVVGNSVRHGDGAGPIELRVAVGSSSVRVEVEDPGHGFRPAPGTRRAEQSDGWGLLLVQRLAARWGVIAAGTTLVWFELDHASG